MTEGLKTPSHQSVYIGYPLEIHRANRVHGNMACGALFRCRHQVAHRAVDSLVCHTAVGANLPSTLVQSSQRTVCQLGVVLHRYRLDCIYIYNACHLFPFLYVKLHRVLRNATVHDRGRKDMSNK